MKITTITFQPLRKITHLKSMGNRKMEILLYYISVYGATTTIILL
jgi:hypothetical protein